MITYSEAQEMMRTARVPRDDRWADKRRKLANNTYLHERGAHYAVRLHCTDIITIHADGTFTLNTGGWETVTTKDRLNNFGPARVYSVDGTWCVIGKNDPVTAPKVQKCRKCSGTGTIHIAASYRHWDYSDYRNPVRLNPPEPISPAHDSECWYCSGDGTRDYGSKPRPVKFYDGIKVDSYGEVTDPDAERMYETAEERDARQARIMAEMERAQRAERDAWFAACKPIGRGEVIVYKAVDDDLCSGYGFAYPIGETVACDDWRPDNGCGGGLHFCANVSDARGYFGSATRYLACAVRKRDAMIIGNGGAGSDKIKAPRARVLWEVDAEGNRING